MAKINISIPDDLLKVLDGLAKSEAKSRSELIREGIMRLQEEIEERRYQEALQKRRLEASQRIDTWREKYGKADRSWQAAKELKRWRAERLRRGVGDR